jgi:hypothetical protein
LSAGRRDEGTALGIQNRDRDSEGGQLRPELERGILLESRTGTRKEDDPGRKIELEAVEVGRQNWKRWR